MLLKNITDKDLASWQKNTILKTVLVGNTRRLHKRKQMKRIGGLYEQIISLDNLRLADQKARKGKLRSYGVKKHDLRRDDNIIDLHNSLKNMTYNTSEYSRFSIVTDNGKEREICRLPYFPDRICHHAVMNIMEPIWVSVFNSNTYSCIKGRGIHAAFRKVKKDLSNNVDETVFCLKIDIKKFYNNIDHPILKSILRRKIKDNNLLWLLVEIIDSSPGVPIGNYLSQFFANLYLGYFDHWIKENQKIKYYYRYADDMVFLSNSKEYLSNVLEEIKDYLFTHLKLSLKSNYQIFPVSKRGIDFVGYRFYHSHILLRKSIKKRFAAKYIALKKSNTIPLIIQRKTSSWKGWAVHCNSKNLLKKLNIL